MVQIKFSTLQEVCCYAELSLLEVEGKVLGKVYFCDIEGSTSVSPTHKRICEECKCPLICKE